MANPKLPTSTELVHEVRRKQLRLRGFEVVILILIIIGVSIAFFVGFAEIEQLRRQISTRDQTIAAIKEANDEMIRNHDKNTDLIVQNINLTKCLLNFHVQGIVGSEEECQKIIGLESQPSRISPTPSSQPDHQIGVNDNANPPPNPPAPTPPPPMPIIGCIPLVITEVCI